MRLYCIVLILLVCSLVNNALPQRVHPFNYESFKSYFSEDTAILIPENIYTKEILYKKNEPRSYSRQIYALQSILGYKGMDLFVCNEVVNYIGDRTYEDDNTDCDFLIAFKDGKPLCSGNDDFSLKFFIDYEKEANGWYRPILESFLDNKKVDKYYVGMKLKKIRCYNKNYLKNGAIKISCPIIIKTLDGNIQLMPDGYFRMLPVARK